MSARIWLGASGSETLLYTAGRILEEEDLEIVREGRTASGKKVKDVIANKKLFRLSYNTTNGPAVEQLQSIYSLTATLSFKVERRDLSIDTYSVDMKPIGYRRESVKGDWILSGVAAELEEI